MIVRLHLSGPTRGFTTCAEISDDIEYHQSKSELGEMQVASYRFSTCNKLVEYFKPVGSGHRISASQLLVILGDNYRDERSFESECSALSALESSSKRALIFLPMSQDLKQVEMSTAKEFRSAFGAQIRKGHGFIAYPVEHGFVPLAATCKCKAFFGCSSGCCTNPTCRVISGFCQANENCKRVDTFSNCSCTRE